MPWVKLDDGFPEHPKTEALSDAAFRLLVTSWCYCGRNLTDGAIPEHRAQRLTATASKKVVAELIAAGYWHTTEDGYEAHQFLERNPSRAEVIEQRERGKERAKRSRERRAHVPMNDDRDEDRTSAVTSPDPYPYPTRETFHSTSSTGHPQPVNDEVAQRIEPSHPTAQAALADMRAAVDRAINGDEPDDQTGGDIVVGPWPL